MFKVSRGASLDRFYLLKLFGFGVFVHRIHHSDPVCLYHSHPWSGLSLIFGGYIEIIRGKLAVRRRWFNWVSATQHHRVVVERPVWTLFIHGRRCNRWSIVNEHGETTSIEPWRGEAGRKDYRNAG